MQRILVNKNMLIGQVALALLYKKKAFHRRI